MKLSSINNATQNNINNYNQSFKGGMTDSLIRFWQFIDNGGRALQFTAEDMTGTNIPRSIKGLTAGIKYTGKLNFLAFAQEAIREFLTGPTMCIVPWVIITLAKKSGKTADTHIENIKNISNIFNQTINSTSKDASKTNKEAFQTAFFNNSVKDMLIQTIGQGTEPKSTQVDEIVKGLKELSANEDKKKEKEILTQLQTTFENIIKTEKKDISTTDFLSCKYSIPNSSRQGATSFKNYMNYLSAYFNDFAKKYSNDFKNGIDTNALLKHNKDFKKSWVGKRALIAFNMIALTGFLMSQIPKLYTMASGKVNPNASVIYDEAKKKDEQPVVIPATSKEVTVVH